MKEELRKYHADSFGWALQCCGRNREMAEEALQQVYLKVLEGKARFNHKGPFKNWLFVVIRNTVRDLQKQKKYASVQVQEDMVPSAQAELIAKEEAQQLQQALQQLSPQQQKVLHLVFYQDATIEEAAAIMNISLGSARTHYQRGKQKLKMLLENQRSEL
ncbi:MAG: sigma-70 family RNA polymerase sigma factor [Saprospiraceae bacterium]|nr:sigma-70 family RNA polymerase sigma factor [Saprospiraceae bacterium]